MIARARRYGLPLPLQYRVGASAEWQPGEVRNISHSGVLFVAERAVAPDTEIEMLIDMNVAASAGVAAAEAGRLLCRGRVVRVVAGKGREHEPAMAATIADFRFARTDGDVEES